MAVDYTHRIFVSCRAANSDGSQTLNRALELRASDPSMILDPTPIKSSEDNKLGFKASRVIMYQVKEELDELGMSYIITPPLND